MLRLLRQKTIYFQQSQLSPITFARHGARQDHHAHTSACEKGIVSPGWWLLCGPLRKRAGSGDNLGWLETRSPRAILTMKSYGLWQPGAGHKAWCLRFLRHQASGGVRFRNPPARRQIWSL